MFRAALKSNFQSVAARFWKNMAAESKRFKHGSSENNMVWVDLEMTGLDVNTEHIIEMACLVTDSQLGIIAEGPNLVIHQPEEVLAAMGDWCTQHHGQSGLTQAVRESQISVKQAEDQMLGFIQQYTIPGKCPLAGNSVHMDKRFLDKYMPSFSKHLHYRIIDVSTIKEICRRWYPAVYSQAPKKGLSHRALDDIKESIKEMQFYQSKIFIPSAEKVV